MIDQIVDEILEAPMATEEEMIDHCDRFVCVDCPIQGRCDLYLKIEAIAIQEEIILKVFSNLSKIKLKFA